MTRTLKIFKDDLGLFTLFWIYLSFIAAKSSCECSTSVISRDCSKPYFQCSGWISEICSLEFQPRIMSYEHGFSSYPTDTTSRLSYWRRYIFVSSLRFLFYFFWEKCELYILWMYKSVGTNVGDIGLWEVGSRERLMQKNFKVWDLSKCSMTLQVCHIFLDKKWQLWFWIDMVSHTFFYGFVNSG